MLWLIIFLTVSILILINALYVAAEFSTVSSRRARLAQYAAEGNQAAAYLLPIVQDHHALDTYIATCQVGITLSSLVMGFYGQRQLSEAIAPLLVRFVGASEIIASSISTTAVLLLLSALQVLLGELVPKNIGVQYPERLALLTTLPMRWSVVIFKPLIWLFNGSGQLILRLLGLHSATAHTHVHSPEEITMLVEESRQGGVLQGEESRFLKNTLQMRQALVRQVMIPRTRMLVASDMTNPIVMRELLVNSAFSRLILFEGTVDNTVGFVHLKDLLCLEDTKKTKRIDKIIRPMLYVPESMPAQEVFARLQRGRMQVALVIDEFGGTAGMVTTEDLIEEIFGDLEDEFDSAAPPMQLRSDGTLWIRGDTPIHEINEHLNLLLSEEDASTLAGTIQRMTGRLPSLGEEIEIEGTNFKIERITRRGIAAISMRPSPEQIKRFEEPSP